MRSGEAYKGYVWIKLPAKDAYTGAISVALEQDNTDGATYSSAVLSNVQGGWHRYDFTLTPAVTDRFAKLSLLCGGHGTLYLDQASLEAADALTQVRPDSEAMIRRLHPSFIRWPGGNVAQDYHWQWGIGPRDLRPVWINKSWSNAPEPNDLGTDEYLALCTRLHIEPSITVNVGGAGATPEEAADWVEYANGPVTSRFGAVRAANGHPAPYGVKQWELGNEIFGGWVRGHVTAEEYANEAVIHARAMRAVDPTLRLIAVGQGMGADGDAWDSTVARIAGPVIQYVAIHDYTSLSQNMNAANPRATMMGRPGEFEANYLHMGDILRKQAPGRDIKLIVNEWNLFYDADTIQSMEGAVFASRMMNGFERDGAVVDSNAISDLLDGWVGGIIQASRDRVYGTPQYYAIDMYSHHLGTDRVATSLSSPELQPGIPSVDAVVTRTADGSSLFVKLSNADRHTAIPTRIDLKGFAHQDAVEVSLLSSPVTSRRNTFADPTAVVPTRQTLHCAQTCVVNLPPDSVAVLTFHR